MQHSPLFLLYGNCSLANLRKGSLELAVNPGFLGKEKAMLIFLLAFLFLPLSPTGCICILRGDHFFLALVTMVRLDLLLLCCTHSLPVGLTSFTGASLLWSGPTTGFSLLTFLSTAVLGGIGSASRAEEKVPLQSASELQQSGRTAPAKHPRAAETSRVKPLGAERYRCSWEKDRWERWRKGLLHSSSAGERRGGRGLLLSWPTVGCAFRSSFAYSWKSSLTHTLGLTESPQAELVAFCKA